MSNGWAFLLQQTTNIKLSIFLHELPVKIGIKLIELIGLLPYALLVFIGKGVGFVMLFLARNRRRIATKNFKLCFPELDNKQRKKLLIDNFLSTGIGLMETAFCWSANADRIKAVTEVSGTEHLSTVLASGQGAIVLGFHLTSLELGGIGLSHRIPIAAMYREHRNKYFEKAMCSGRLKHVTDVIERDDVRNMIRSLKGGKAVWYAADQDYGANHSIFVPFFNYPTATITATSRFVKLTKVPVIPMTHYRDKKSNKLLIQLHPPLENFTAKDDYTDALVINQILENFLHQFPAEYLWVHRRFKTRPPGMPFLYDAKSLYKIKVMLNDRYQKILSESELVEGTVERPLLLKFTSNQYFKFIYRSYLLQPSPARKYTRQWQKNQHQSKQQILALFRYLPLNVEVVHYQQLNTSASTAAANSDIAVKTISGGN